MSKKAWSGLGLLGPMDVKSWMELVLSWELGLVGLLVWLSLLMSYGFLDWA
jgi:hypothetical protein